MNNSVKTILLVEDEVLIAMAEERQLVNAGYNVVTAFSGDDAVDLVKKGDTKIDLVLMDIDLGKGIDGTQAALKILEIYDIPVLFQSSHTEKDVVEKTEKITSYGYVVKHSGITILDASIKMAFKLHRAYLELKEKEEVLLIKERAIESSINAIAMSDPDGKLFYVNQSFLNLWNYNNDKEVIGQSALNFWQDPDTATCVIDSLHSIGGWRGEMIARKKDGTIFDAEASASIIYCQNNKHVGMIAAFQDITERKIAEQRIRETSESYRVLVENVDSVVCETDSDGRYTYLSPACKKITGYEPEELYGKSFFDFVHPDDFNLLKSKFRDMNVSGATSHDIWRFMLKDGTWGWMDCSSACYEKSPDNSRIVIISKDITRRINEEKKMARMIRGNEAYLQELRLRVTSNAGIIRGFVDFLKSVFADDVSRRIFLKAESRIWFVLKLYEQLHISPEPHGVNLYNYVSDIIRLISEIYGYQTECIIISRRLVDIALDVKWVLPIGIIMNEFITNSLKHAYPENKNGEVYISHTTSGRELTLCVADKGSGYRTGISDDKYECLGLKLVNVISSQIGGNMRFENNPGAAFYISINII